MTEVNPDKNTEWAEERTDWAEDRTILAVERTFAGWMRTAFAAIGIGIAFRALFGNFEPPWLARAIATIFIAMGGISSVLAERRAKIAFDKLRTHAIDPIGAPNLRWIAWTIAAVSALLIIGLWLLHNPSAARG